jgi:hypothetical protein
LEIAGLRIFLKLYCGVTFFPDDCNEVVTEIFGSTGGTVAPFVQTGHNLLVVVRGSKNGAKE